MTRKNIYTIPHVRQHITNNPNSRRPKRRTSTRRSRSTKRDTPIYKACGVAKSTWVNLAPAVRVGLAKQRIYSVLDAIREHKVTASISGRTISDSMLKTESYLQELVNDERTLNYVVV